MMRLCYVLLSPTRGIHQYTADLANRMAAAGHEVHLVTTRRVPRDRYAPSVAIHTPVDTRDRGFSAGGLLAAPFVIRQTLAAIRQVAPDVVHITGPHLVNPLLLRALRRDGTPAPQTTRDGVPTPHTSPTSPTSPTPPTSPRTRGAVAETRGAVAETRGAVAETRGAVPQRTRDAPQEGIVTVAIAETRGGVPTVHTLHDLHPHAGAAYGRLLYVWNGWVRREAGHLLVLGQRYQAELLACGVATSRVTCTPLTHLFVSYERQRALEQALPDVSYEPFALFIGRLEEYKGLDVLVEAARRMAGHGAPRQTLPRTQGGVAERGMEYRGVVIAGPGRLERYVRGPLPANVELHSGLVDDEQAVELFRRCGLVVLPYIEASQSALPAAAYFFGKPVVVSRAGALPEYVVEGETGWVVPPGDPQALAEVLVVALADAQRLAQMGCAGRAWYERQRLAEGVALQALYASLAGE